MFVNHDVTFDRPPRVPTNHQLFDLVLEWTRHQHLVLLIPSRFLNLKKKQLYIQKCTTTRLLKISAGLWDMTTTVQQFGFQGQTREEKEPETKGGDRGATHRKNCLTSRWKTTFCHFHLMEVRRTKNAAIKYFSEKPNNKLELFFSLPGRRQLLTTDRKWKFGHCLLTMTSKESFIGVSFGAVLLVLWYLNQWMANNWIPVVQQEEGTTTDFSFFGWTVPWILTC